MARNCDVVRVFTKGEAGGNPLGVVVDLDELDGAGMQAIAAEVGFSETVFIDDATSDAPYIRIFTPVAELQFAGHPLVGSVAWLAARGRTPAHLRCGIGVVEARFHEGVAWVDAPLDQPLELAAHADGYEPGVVVSSVAIVEMPIPYYMIEVADSDKVRRARPAERAMVTVFARLDGHNVHSRFFASPVGVPEDPATGSAAVALAAVFSARGEGRGDVTIAQGEEMGVPSEIELRWADGVASIGGATIAEPSRRVSR